MRYRTEVRTTGALRERFGDAHSSKLRAEAITHGYDAELERNYANLCSLKEEAHQYLMIIEREALKPYPLSELEYIELLIESEKYEHREGWEHRMKYLEKYKNEAALIDVIKIDNIDEIIKEGKYSGRKEGMEKHERLQHIKHTVDEIKQKKRNK